MARLGFNLQTTHKRHKHKIAGIYEFPSYFVSIAKYEGLFFWSKNGEYQRHRRYFNSGPIIWCLSPDQKHFAMGFVHDGVRLIDTETTNLVKGNIYADPSINRPHALHYTPDSQRLLIVCRYYVRAHDLQTRQIEHEIRTRIPTHRVVTCNNELALLHITYPDPVLYGKDNTREVFWVWNHRTGEVHWEMDWEVYSACFLPDGKTVFLEVPDRLNIHNLRTGELLQQFDFLRLSRAAYSDYLEFRQIFLMMDNAYALLIARKAIYLVPIERLHAMICIYTSPHLIVNVHRLDDYHFVVVESSGQISLRALPFNHLMVDIQLNSPLTTSLYSPETEQFVLGSEDGQLHFVELAGIQNALNHDAEALHKYDAEYLPKK